MSNDIAKTRRTRKRAPKIPTVDRERRHLELVTDGWLVQRAGGSVVVPLTAAQGRRAFRRGRTTVARPDPPSPRLL